MNQTCPQCYSQLASSEVGNLCVNCGYLQRRHHNHAPLQDGDTESLDNSHHLHDDYMVPGNLEAPKGLDALLFNQDSSRDTPDTTPSDQNETFYGDTPSIPAERPQIINHHSSSQYRRRLERQLHTLETPEIESSIEPDNSLDAPEVNPMLPQTDTSEFATTQTHNQMEPAEMIQEDAIEVNEPHRPSPYLINMSETDTEATDKSPEYHSPLDKPITPKPAQHHDSHPQKSGVKPGSSSSTEADAAMARAEALLAAAAGPQKDTSTSKTNYIIIAATVVILLGIGSFLAFTLLRKPTPQNSPAPSNGSTSTQSTSPTPTNLTESAKRDAERKDTLNTIAIALAAYKKANGTYPSGNDIEVLSALTSSNPPYLRVIKTDPLSNADSGVIIKYGYSSDGTKFTLTASLENKQDADAANGLYVVKSP